MLHEPLNRHDARKLLTEIIDSDEGRVRFTGHAYDQMEARCIDESEAWIVLRNGYVESSDFIGGSWRYRITGRPCTVAVAFDSETKTVVITAWK
jgi:hypothetical protein